jgi:hypothetical protein
VLNYVERKKILNEKSFKSFLKCNGKNVGAIALQEKGLNI